MSAKSKFEHTRIEATLNWAWCMSVDEVYHRIRVALDIAECQASSRFTATPIHFRDDGTLSAIQAPLRIGKPGNSDVVDGERNLANLYPVPIRGDSPLQSFDGRKMHDE